MKKMRNCVFMQVLGFTSLVFSVYLFDANQYLQNGRACFDAARLAHISASYNLRCTGFSYHSRTLLSLSDSYTCKLVY